MNKTEFLSQLRAGLDGLSASEINEIISDQEEYISDGIRSGRVEEDIIQSLGSPKEMARQLKLGVNFKTTSKEKNLIPKLKGIGKVMIGLCLLAPLNFFILLFPASMIGSILFVAWMLATGLGIGSGLFLVIRFMLADLPSVEIVWTILMSIGGMGLSVLSLIGCYFVTWFLLKTFVRYLEWNYRFLEASYEERH